MLSDHTAQNILIVFAFISHRAWFRTKIGKLISVTEISFSIISFPFVLAALIEKTKRNVSVCTRSYTLSM